MVAHIFDRVATKIGKYPLLFLCVLFIVWAFMYLVLPETYFRDVLAPQGEEDRVYFGNTVVVSQEFIPHRGLSSIEIPLGSATNPGTPLILHIRELSSNEDIISVPLFSFNDEIARFRFNPLWKVSNQLEWVLEAPHAASKSFWVYREKDSSIFTEGNVYLNTRRLQGNIAFREIWKTPRVVALIYGKTFSPSFNDFEYTSFMVGVASVMLLSIFRRIYVKELHFVIACIAIGVGLHIWLALNMPLIIDEGAYIQDVLQSSHTLLPFRDFLTKGPIYLFLLWIWSHVVPHTVVTWRLFSAIFWAFGGVVFWKLTQEFGLRERSRLIAVATWNLMPAAVALTTPLLLQTSSVAISLLGMVLGVRATTRASWKLAAASALVFTAAFFMRVTSAIPAVITLLLILLYVKKSWNIKLAATYVCTGVLAFGLVFGAGTAFLGPQKAAVLVNMEAFLISQNRQERIQSTSTEQEPIIRSVTIESRLFWRTGVLLITAILLVPLLFVTRERIVPSIFVILGVFYIGWNISVHLQDTGFLLPKKFVSTIWLITSLLFGVPLVTALAALIYNTRTQARKYFRSYAILVLIVIWLVLTAFVYAKWGRFRQSYLTEFIPQLALLLGIGLDFTLGLWGKIQPRWFSYSARSALLVLICMSVYQGYVLAHKYPHTGTIDQASLVNISRLIQSHVPKNDTIFTGQPVATAFANRQILFGYSHPGWYREARFGTISEDLRNLLFRTPEDITMYLATEAPFVLMDSRTNEIYFDGYPERIKILEESYEVIDSTVNEMSGETYTLYRRVYR